jgi:hypothetical protein
MVDTSLALRGIRSVHASAVPDSTLLLFSMSLATGCSISGATMQPVADPRQLTVKTDSAVIRQVNRDEKVRVRSMPETMRRDETSSSAGARRYAGIYTVSVVVRDGPVPRTRTSLLDRCRSSVAGFERAMPVYGGVGRTRLNALPGSSNPRGAAVSNGPLLRRATDLPRHWSRRVSSISTASSCGATR